MILDIDIINDKNSTKLLISDQNFQKFLSNNIRFL